MMPLGDNPKLPKCIHGFSANPEWSAIVVFRDVLLRFFRIAEFLQVSPRPMRAVDSQILEI
jgi:hypothetical protein